MTIDDVLDQLSEGGEVLESYVLVRQLKVYLDVGHPQFHPGVGIKIYRTRFHGTEAFTFDVSHHVHTPTQMGPYHPSNTMAESEREALRMALSTTTSYLRSAIREGHEPRESWLIANEDF